MNPLALACLLLARNPDDDVQRLLDLRRSIREKTAQAVALVRSAHEELDRAAYEIAVGKRRSARALEAECELLRRSEAELVEKAAGELLHDLDSDTVETRDRASKLLLALGPAALPVLERLFPGPSAESQYRLTDAVAVLRRMEIDAEGRLHQWARTARASSEYRPDDWSAMQATGRPDTAGAGDARTAWASLSADGGEEWLELGYEHAVSVTQVRVHETFNPGAVIRVEARDGEGTWRMLWEGKDAVHEAPGWCSVSVKAGIATRAIRITLESANVAGWNAVELIGDSSP
jgi:hypothetical protein